MRIILFRSNNFFDSRVNKYHNYYERAGIDYTILNPERLANEFDKYVKKNKRTLLSYFEPYTSRVTLKLYRMGLFPSLLTNKKKVLMLNRIRCESHQLVYTTLLSQSLNLPF